MQSNRLRALKNIWKTKAKYVIFKNVEMMRSLPEIITRILR